MKLGRRSILWLIWLLRVVIFAIDCLEPASLNMAFCYIVVSFLFKDVGITRRDLWLMAFASVAFTLLTPLIGLPVTPGESISIIWFDRVMLAATILIVAYDQDKSAKAEHELHKAIRAREVFLATLAHELRNPLASIHSGIATMQRTPSPDESRRKLVEIMKRQVEHLVRLVDELLEISRIKGGKIKLRTEPEDISVIVEGVLEAYRPRFEAAHQRISLRVHQDTLITEVDPVRIAQVFANLLDNASKFTPEGGAVDVSIERKDEWVAISVRDNGRGISPDALPNIFSLFAQGVDFAPTKGLGIGLALVREIIELHEGTVEAHSAGLGQGSEFIVRLPLRRAVSMACKRPA
jgi:signal transduction histidine kinase